MEAREKKIYKVTLIGSLVNAALIILKFIAGIVGRSSAMLADAVHSLSDFVTDVIVIVFVRISGKPSDKKHEYGHGKYETFATFIIGLLLALAGFGLMIGGIYKISASLSGHSLPRPTMLALIVAIISIVSKEWLYHNTIRKGRETNSPAVIANAWHHRSDAISSIGTMIGVSGAMFLGDKWRILDPIAAIVVSLFIIKSGYDILRPCVSELLEASLPDDQQQEIMRLVKSVAGIQQIHNLRSRRVGNSVVIDLHACMDGSLTLYEAHSIATLAEKAVKEHFGSNTIINIHMEPIKHT